HRLAAPGFTDQAEGFPASNLETHIVDCGDRTTCLVEHCGEVRNRQQCHRRSSNSPNTVRIVSAISPTVARASTAATIGGTRLLPSAAARETAASPSRHAFASRP